MIRYIPLEQCVDGNVYYIRARNFRLGVYHAAVKGFIGVREKFGNTYLFTEYHYDTGAPFGTVFPTKDFGPLPEGIVVSEYDDNRKLNRPLFDFLEAFPIPDKEVLEYEEPK